MDFFLQFLQAIKIGFDYFGASNFLAHVFLSLIIPQNPRKSKIKEYKGGNSIFLTHFAAPNFFLNHGMFIFLGTAISL
jgi:hypothetical protein